LSNVERESVVNLTPTLLIAFRTDFIFRPPSPPFQLQSSPRVIYCKTICDRLAAGGVSFEITMLARRPSTRRNIFQQQYVPLRCIRCLSFAAGFSGETWCADRMRRHSCFLCKSCDRVKLHNSKLGEPGTNRHTFIRKICREYT